MQARDAAKAWKARELELRMFIARNFGYNHDVQGSLPDGMHKMDIGNGYALSLQVSTKTEVRDNAGLNNFLTVVRSMPDGYTTVEAILRHKWSLDKRGFAAATPEVQRLLLPALETKNNTPQLDLDIPL